MLLIANSLVEIHLILWMTLVYIYIYTHTDYFDWNLKETNEHIKSSNYSQCWITLLSADYYYKRQLSDIWIIYTNND